MAKSKAVQTLLATAVAIAGTVENVELKTAIDELEALEDATHSNAEYKALKEIVDALEDGAENTGDKNTGGDAGDDADAKAKAEKEAQDKLDAEKKAQLEAQNAKDKKPAKKNALKYAGVKMIGGKWYCKKDNYKKGFATADECAEHYNG